MTNGRRGISGVVLFALTIFVSAFLLFQVQPLISKMILPWFGGSPAVWTTAMLFFQSTLFAGYVYAHLLATYASPRTQRLVHTTLLLVAAALAARIIPESSWKPSGSENPISDILLLLSVSVGLPFFVLSTTGPLVQHWYLRASASRSVFRLYALSNVGSFLALLTFPYAFEPLFELTQLGRFWTYAFWLFAVLGVCVTLWSTRTITDFAPEVSIGDTTVTKDLPPTKVNRLLWVTLPALGSLAFIATTDHVSHNVAPEPRLWIMTLSLYLLTFIICFDHSRWYRRSWAAPVCLLAIVLLSGQSELSEWFGFELDLTASQMRWMYLATMFLICFLAHGELYRIRPAQARYLTEFYLLMSLGGAFGGLFVALVATNLFSDYHEWSLLLLATIALASMVTASAWGASSMQRGTLLLISAGLGCLVLFWEDPLRIRGEPSAQYSSKLLHQSRNFYGTVSAFERRYKDEPQDDYRVFLSGLVPHGVQYLAPNRRRQAVSYYPPDSGLGETIAYAQARQPSLQVAGIGLGAGILATYARPTDHYDFYEINPEVVQIARQWFDYLSDSKASSKNIILGDARLRMETLPPDTRYDLIVLDAFSGGSVPIHLLTREAFAIYRQHLKPDGLIAIHITNAYLNLYPVVRRQAEVLGMGFRNRFQPSRLDEMIRNNHWFIMTHDQQYLQRFPSVNRQHVDEQGRVFREEDPNLPGVPVWTDHFSSLSPIELTD